MKKTITAGLILSLISNTPLAMPTPPQACPSAQSIKQIPILKAVKLANYFGASTGNFGTDNLWMFILGPVKADDENDAVRKSNVIVQNLSGHPIPQSSGNDWLCEYSLPGDLVAMAQYGGPLNQSFSMAAIKRQVLNRHLK